MALHIGSCLGYLRLFLPCSFLCLPCVKDPAVIVQEGTELLVTRFGRIDRIKRSGLTLVNPYCQRSNNCDIRMRVYELGKQTVMTKDYILVNMQGILYCRIVKSVWATFRVEQLDESLMELALAVVKGTVGSLTFSELLGGKQKVAQRVEDQIDHVARRWGIQIQKLLLKDVQIEEQVQRQLTAKPFAERQAEAVMMQAEGSVLLAEKMKQSSSLLSSQTAMKMRFINSLQMMIKSSTVMFGKRFQHQQEQQTNTPPATQITNFD